MSSDSWSDVRRSGPTHRVNGRDGTEWSLVSKISVGMTFALLGGLAAILMGAPSNCPYAPPIDRTYPLTAPQILANGARKYKIAVITDLDERSLMTDQKNTWQSHMRHGYLTIDKDNKKVSIEWEKKSIALKSTLSQGGRSMELSDLKAFNGVLLSVDDRTGVVYKIDANSDKPIPWVLLADGDGHVPKGFKAEWMTVKDDVLYVGGLGKEWTTTEGVFQNYNPMYVKTVTHTGYVSHVRFVDEYKAVRAAAGIHQPGYMIHEAAQWSDIHKRWFFLPRRASNEMYTEADDEHRATNYLIVADEDFKVVEARHLGPLSNTRGFSAFQFIPGTNDQVIVALKSEEDRGKIRSYITVIGLDNKVLLPETLLEGEYKFEGIEFV